MGLPSRSAAVTQSLSTKGSPNGMAQRHSKLMTSWSTSGERAAPTNPRSAKPMSYCWAELFGREPPCGICSGDVDGNGMVDAFDIEPFLECLFP